MASLIGVVLGGMAMIYTAVRSLMFAQGLRSHRFMNGGNFNAGQFANFTARQFGNFTGNYNGGQRLGYANAYGGFVNYLAIIAAVIAIVGILWLGIALNSQHRL